MLFKKILVPVIFIPVLLTFVSSCKNEISSEEEIYRVPAEIAALPLGISPGLRAPEIELPNLEGDTIRLSSLHGKLVLVDFRAAWSNACRQEAPNQIKVYEKYADVSFPVGEGFEIVSVSLDRSKDDWRASVLSDKLTWKYQLGDMQGANSQAALDYQIEKIPANFLLDRNGVIIANNLFGEELGEMLGRAAENNGSTPN